MYILFSTRIWYTIKFKKVRKNREKQPFFYDKIITVVIVGNENLLTLLLFNCEILSVRNQTEKVKTPRLRYKEQFKHYSFNIGINYTS